MYKESSVCVYVCVCVLDRDQSSQEGIKIVISSHPNLPFLIPDIGIDTRLRSSIGRSQGAEGCSTDEVTISDHKVSVALNVISLVHPSHDLGQESSLLLISARSLELGDPERTVSTSGVGLGHVLLKSSGIAAVVPMDGDFVDRAGRAGADEVG